MQNVMFCANQLNYFNVFMWTAIDYPPNLRLKSLNILRAKFKKETSLDASHGNQTA